MVKSILLQGFDRQIADKIGEYMKEHKRIVFIRKCVPTKIEQVIAGTPGKLKVHGKYSDGTDYSNDFNTVIFAMGHTVETDTLNLEAAGVKVDPTSNKIITDNYECSSNSHIFAIGKSIISYQFCILHCSISIFR